MPKVDRSASPSTAAAPTKTAAVKDARPVKYPKIVVSGVEIPADALRKTAKDVVDLMGLEFESDEVKFGDSYLFKDIHGAKVRATRNSTNRPLNEPWAKTIAQDILNRNYKFNGETWVVGRFGSTLSMQHRGVGLFLADQMWHDDDHWRGDGKWPDGPPWIETLVVYGIDESPETTRTLDNVRTRTLTDVLLTSGVFDRSDPKDRGKLTGMLANAVRLLWHRAGADRDAYSPRRSHSESVDFIDRHPRLLKAVKHIHEENASRAVGNWIGEGTASGLLFMMGCSASDPTKYRASAHPHERMLDWSRWETACEFWTMLAGRAPELRAVTQAKRPVDGDADEKSFSGYIFGEGDDSGTAAERMAVIIKAWNEFASGSKPTASSVRLVYERRESEDGIVSFVLDESPQIEGIDVGEPDPDEPNDEEQEEIEEAVAEEKAAKDKKADTKGDEKTGTSNPVADAIAALRLQHPDKVLIFKLSAGRGYTAWGHDAHKVADVTGSKAKTRPDGLIQVALPSTTDVEAVARMLRVGGHRIALVGEDGSTVTDMVAPAVPPKADRKPVATPAPTAPREENGKPTPAAAAPVKGKLKLRGGTEK